jgi:hypothetical protein
MQVLEMLAKKSMADTGGASASKTELVQVCKCV